MLTFDEFQRIVDQALGRRSARDVCRNAGLPPNALSHVREGKQPTWDRAAKIADALGLELRICRKGETIKPLALRLALLELLSLTPSSDVSTINILADQIGGSYERWEKAFGLASPNEWERVYEVCAVALLRLGRKAIAESHSPEALRTLAAAQAAHDAVLDTLPQVDAGVRAVVDAVKSTPPQNLDAGDDDAAPTTPTPDPADDPENG